MNKFTPQQYCDGLSRLKPKSISGQQFIDESVNVVKTTPFSNTLAFNIATSAANSADVEVKQWGESQLRYIDENYITFHLNMLCESTKYDNTAFKSFKSFVKNMLDEQSSDIVRAIAVDGILNNYSMLPEVKHIIARAKNILYASLANDIAQKPGITTDTVFNEIGLVYQLNASTFLATSPDAVFIIDSANSVIDQATPSSVQLALDTELFNVDLSEVSTHAAYLKTLMSYYDASLNMFKLNLLNMQITWQLDTNQLTLEGKEIDSIQQIHAAIQAKASTMQSSSTSKFADMINEADVTLPALLTIFENRDKLVRLNSILTVVHNGTKFYIAHNESASIDKKAVYTVFAKYTNSVGLFKTTYEYFDDMILVFDKNYNVINSLQNIFAAEIAAEKKYKESIEMQKLVLHETINKLKAQRDELLAAKDNLPESALSKVNAQIMTIDDLIKSNEAKLQ